MSPSFRQKVEDLPILKRLFPSAARPNVFQKIPPIHSPAGWPPGVPKDLSVGRN